MRTKALAVPALVAALVTGLFLNHAQGGESSQDQAPAQNAAFPESFFFPNNRDELKVMEGKPAPGLFLAEFINGEGFTNEDLKGKITVVDLWATWCGPCIAAIPKNNAVARKYASKGVQVIGVCTSKNGQEKLADSVKQHKIEYLVAKDPDLKTQQAWNVKFYPTYAIVDREGVVRGIGLMPDKVEPAIQMLLKEQPAPESAGSAQTAGEAQKDELQVVLSSTLQGKIDPNWLEGDEQDRARLKDLSVPEATLGEWLNAEGLKEGSGIVDRLPEGTKLVLVDFWATWCGPCIASIPKTNELQEKYRDKGLVIIGVCHSQGAEKMGETVKEKGIKYPVAADEQGKTVASFRANSFPDYYFLDARGNVLAADVKNAHVEDVIKALLGADSHAAAR